MPSEIERQYLVADERWREEADAGTSIVQGYLAADPERAVRVRIRDGDATLNLKGATDGASRVEFEYDLPADEAREILDDLALRPLIEKRRHLVERDGYTWEIDVFTGANAGLVLAEVEVGDEQEVPPLPEWVGEDVTGDSRYYNASLVQRPFGEW
ncbi:MAG: CYTH domain-containing protein [Acidimicrobiia bacterium]|nr:CYTH domain-containing protein [Acidimicrobiia bacterium]